MPEPPPEERWRADAYLLLAALLARPPDEALLASLRALEPAGDGALAAAWDGLKQAAARARADALADEYHALFIGLGRGELVPYGSWYLTGYLMEKPLADLRLDLKRLGYARREGVSEPEDHAAALCEIMSSLISEGASLDAQREFFGRHLRPWLPRFFEDLAKAKTADFYRPVGALGRAFVEVEAACLDMPE